MEEKFEIEDEKSSLVPREASIVLLSVMMLVSVIVHISLMYCCASYAFSSYSGEIKNDRKWTKELPVMQVQKVDGDPMAEEFLRNYGY